MAGVATVAEQAVVARRTVGGVLVIGADAGRAGVVDGADQPVITGAGVRIFRVAAVGSLVAAFAAVSIAVRPVTRVAGACTAARLTGVESVAVQPVIAGCSIRHTGKRSDGSDRPQIFNACLPRYNLDMTVPIGKFSILAIS